MTEDTNKVTLHAVDMVIDEESTNIKVYPLADGQGTAIKVSRQYNDSERQFHVIEAAETLKAGKQYLVYLKYVGNLNDYLQGFYRSSYVVNQQKRFVYFSLISIFHCDRYVNI